MPPPDLVALLNRYFTEMSDVIETHGGLIDKYVGDAIVAVFGAPLNDPRHAESAVRAALRCCERLAPFNANSRAQGGPTLAHRIGINSGRAIVGNVGSRRRFNYTVIGDAVNFASRLEGTNRHYGTSIIASENTVKLSGNAFVWRELDLVRVNGRAELVGIYEPLALAEAAKADDATRVERYREGLVLWREGGVRAGCGRVRPDRRSRRAVGDFMKSANAAAQAPPRTNREPIATLE